MSEVLDRELIESFVIDKLVVLGVDRSQITPESTFDELEVDSLDFVELTQAVKKELAIPVAPKDFDDSSTVGQALATIYQKAGLG